MEKLKIGDLTIYELDEYGEVEIEIDGNMNQSEDINRENSILIVDNLSRQFNLETYVVSFENDGDFPECEIVLGTNSYKEAVEKAKLRPNTYAYSEITVFVNGKKFREEQYGHDSVFPDTSKM